MFPFIFFNESTSLYIYSALFQANAAILSIIGVFIIFRLQSLQSHVDTLKNFILTTYDDKDKVTRFFLFEQGDLKMKYQMIETKDKLPEENEKIDEKTFRIENPFELWFYKERELLQTKNLIKLPIRLLLVALIINGFSLLFASNIHAYHPIFEVDLEYINILYEVLVLLVISSRMIFMVTKRAPLFSAKKELYDLRNYIKEREMREDKEWKDKYESKIIRFGRMGMERINELLLSKSHIQS